MNEKTQNVDVVANNDANVVAGAAGVVVNPVDAVMAEDDATQVVNVFDNILGDNQDDVKSTDDIIKELLASPRCRRVNGLTVTNVVATPMDGYAFITFVVKEWLVGDVRDNEVLDVFGKPTVKLGRTHNVQTSDYAVSGVMKQKAKLAIFAGKVVDDPSIALDLFVGAKIDVIMEFVPEHTDYVNPFSKKKNVTQFDRDKVIHHVVNLSLGEVGEDLYREAIMQHAKR